MFVNTGEMGDLERSRRRDPAVEFVRRPDHDDHLVIFDLLVIQRIELTGETVLRHEFAHLAKRFVWRAGNDRHWRVI